MLLKHIRWRDIFDEIVKRIFHDWVASLRYNSHSPYGTGISFEILVSRV
jgi:hypothetical protein